MSNTRGTDHTMSFARANVIGGIGGIAGAAVTMLAFGMIRGTVALGAVGDAIDEHFALVLLAMAGGIVVHEALHGIGFIYFGRVPRSSVRYGVNWKTLTPFAGTSAVMRARGYRWAVALPGLVLGVVPWLWSIATGDGLLAAFGAFMVAGAGGDAAALWAMRHVAADALVQDAKERVGCEVVTPSDAPGAVHESA